MNTGPATLDSSDPTELPAFAELPDTSECGMQPLPDRLLLAVARALKVLLGAGALHDNIGLALRMLGEAARMHRVKVILPQPVEVGQAPRHALVYEWWAAGFDSQTSLGVVDFPDAAIEEYLQTLRRGKSVWRLIDEVSNELRTAFERVGMRSMGVVPIFAKDRYAGMVAFDDCTGPRRWSQAEVEALTIAAHAIGAAIERERIEAARLQAEQARADQAEADSRALRQREGLLRTVTEATRALLADTDFDAAIQSGLALLGNALGVPRAGLVRDIPLPQDDAPGGWRLTHEWKADGVAARMGSAAQAGEYPAPGVWLRLRSGEAVAQRLEDADAGFSDSISADRTLTTLTVPLFLAGRYWGLMCFDQSHDHEWADHELAVLKTAAACVSAALERREAESRRVAESERHSARLQRHSRLLAAVAQSAEELLATHELPPCLDAVLARIGAVTCADRAAVVRLDWTPSDAEVACWQVVLNEWTKPGAQRQSDTDLHRLAMRRDDTTLGLLEQQLESDGRILALIEDCGEPFRSEQMSLGVIWSLVYPVTVDGALWGLLGFDYATPFDDYDEADLAALKTVASTISDALERERMEAARLAAERARADEALALNRLLEGVVAASKALLDEPDLDVGLARWLAHLGQAFDADAANIGCLLPPGQQGEGNTLARTTAEWLRPGVEPVDQYEVPATPDFLAWQDALGRGEIVFGRLQDLTDEASIHHWVSQGIHAGVMVPVMVDQRLTHFLAVMWLQPRAWAPAFSALMHTAADGLASAIKRSEAARDLLAERERAAGERTAELAQTNASMRRTLARLAAAEDVDAFLATALLELRLQAGAEAAYLFAVNEDAGDGLLRLRGAVGADGFHRQAQQDDPTVFVDGFLPTPRAVAAMKQGSWLLWRPVAGHGVTPRHPDVQHWLLRRGVAADACCLLQVGERCVGLVALLLTSAEPLPASRCELLVALSQPMALALELGRLGHAAQRAAQDRAVLAERNRMARDVHDTLAQGFTAISLQLQAAARAEHPEDRAHFVARATREAQANLVESRRTIRLLRGMAEPGQTTHTLTHVIEDALASRLSGSGLPWRVLPLPDGVPEPALGAEARRELERIAQEAATNALKHARAPSFEARLSLLPDGTLVVRLEDQGRGFDPDALPDGFGLLGMRERAERIGAELQIESRPGGPTAVVVLVPPSSPRAGA